MSRMDKKRYERQVMLSMAIYMAVLFAANPLLRATHSLPLKTMLALVPVLPVLYVIALMWRRIRDGDELEQRTNLIALGVAAALVAALSLIGGFLSAGGVVQLGGDVLIWVFPVLMMGYGVAYKWVSRRYGVDSICAEDSSVWLSWYFAAIGAAMLVYALYLWRQGQLRSAAIMLAAALIFIAMGAWVRRRRAHARRQAERDGA